MCVGEGERLYLVAGNCFSRREALSESYCSILLEREREGGGGGVRKFKGGKISYN